MESMKLLMLVFFSISLPLANSFALTETTPIQGAADAIKHSLEKYSRVTGGKTPSSWKELDDFLLKDEQAKYPESTGRSTVFSDLDKRLGRSVEESFTLVAPSLVEMVSPNSNEIFSGGSIVAVLNMPVKDDRKEKPGRYVLWKSANGSIRSSWLDDVIVNAQFKKAGLKLVDGTVQIEPPTVEGEIKRIDNEYAAKHFKYPEKPTAEELEQAKKYFEEKSQDVRKGGTSGPNKINPESKANSSLETAPQPLVAKTGWRMITLAFIVIIIGGFIGIRLIKSDPSKK